MTEYVRVSIIRVDLEPTLCRCKPAIDDRMHVEPPLAQPESEWLLLAGIPCIAFHAKLHVLTIPRTASEISCRS